MDRAPTDILATLETRDPGVFRHSRQVALHSATIARRLDLPAVQVLQIRRAALFHDIGKSLISKEILAVPGALTEEEFAVVKRHPEAGARLVERLGDPELTRIVLHHHERFDGDGYPAGLSGEAIPLGARIVAVADAFDALTSERSYRSAMVAAEALALLEAVAGTQLDPGVVRPFVRSHSGPRRFPTAVERSGAVAPAQAERTRRGPSTTRAIR